MTLRSSGRPAVLRAGHQALGFRPTLCAGRPARNVVGRSLAQTLRTPSSAMAHPSVFYKYASAETAALVLEHGRIRWSSPSVFNDLSEFQRMPRFVPTIAESLLSLPGYLSSAIVGEVVLDIGCLAPQTRLLMAMLQMLGAAAPTVIV